MGHLIATIGLAPILFAQGRYVIRNIPRLPEPPGQRQGVTGVGQPLRLLVLGDSSAAGVGAATLDEALLGQVVTGLETTFQVRWSLIARTGATTRGTIKHLEKQPAQPFDAVVTALGVNDVTNGRSVRVWMREQAQLVDLLRSKFNVQHLYMSGLPPVSHFPALPQPLRWYLGSQAKRFDRSLGKWVQSQPDCSFISFNFTLDTNLMASDKFHPGPQIYAHWGAEVAYEIRQTLRRD